MQLQFRRLLPEYFEEDNTDSSDIWGKEIVFNKGEMLKIVAPSGSGKTSLIHFLYGIRKEYIGDIFYDEKNISGFQTEDFSRYRRDHLSIVFQDLRLFPEQTVFENIEIKRQLNPFHPPEKIKEMAERLGIGNKSGAKCRICSFGEQQRIAIIRALMQPYDFLLLDEPFSHLDKANAQKALELILEESSKRNAGILFADLEQNDNFPFSRLFHL
jgi:putative ABC transport system ATP-binding protein